MVAILDSAKAEWIWDGQMDFGFYMQIHWMERIDLSPPVIPFMFYFNSLNNNRSFGGFYDRDYKFE